MAKADPNRADKLRLRELAGKAERTRKDAARATRNRDRAIRRIAAKGKLSQREIARAVGTSHTQIQTILRADD